jgi:hypothetical protein
MQGTFIKPKGVMMGVGVGGISRTWVNMFMMVLSKRCPLSGDGWVRSEEGLRVPM